jgi:DNA-binding CsgD family transcriptional regulator
LRGIEARHSNDPTMVFLHALADPKRDPDEPVIYRQVFDDAFLANSPLYQEISQQVSMADAIATLALLQPNRLGFVAMQREQPGKVFGVREATLMRTLAPHIRRAVTISNILEMRTIEAHALSATLDTIAAGVILVSADARVLHANVVAKAALDIGTSVSLSNGRIALSTNAATEQLRAAIRAAAAPARDLGGFGYRGVPIGDKTTAHAIAHVLPLTTGALRLPSAAVAAIFITSSDVPLPGISNGIGAMYGLTATETRLLAELALGATLAEAAASLGIGKNTAKTHVGRIFAKTGVSRQAELVALLGRLMPPTA